MFPVPTAPQRPPNVPLYAGVGCACGVALLITLILLIFCIVTWYETHTASYSYNALWFFFRKRKLLEISAVDSQPANCKRYSRNDTITLDPLLEEEEHEETEEGKFQWLKLNGITPVIITLEKQRLAPVLISEFSEYVKKKHQNSNIDFEDEFDVYLNLLVTYDVSIQFTACPLISPVSSSEAHLFICSSQDKEKWYQKQIWKYLPMWVIV